MEFLVSLFALLISLATALVVFVKNPKNGTNFYFALLVFFIGAYPVFNYLAVSSSSDAHAFIWAKCILLVSIPQGPLLYFFAKTFPDSNFIFNLRRQVFLACWVLLDLILASLGLIFKGVSVQDNVVSIQPGPFIPLFGLLHITTIIAGLTVLYSKYKKSKSNDKRQLRFIFFGILISFSLTFLITFILPLILKNTFLLALSPIFLTLSVVAAAYAIVRHKLFDIRAAVARAVAYIMTISFLAFLYTAMIFGITNVFIPGGALDSRSRVIYTVTALLLAFSFSWIKNFFDKLSDRIFFHDRYDPQNFLNELNQVLVEKIDLNPLLEGSAEVIRSAIKTNTVTFVIRETSYSPRRIIGDKVAFSDENHADLKAHSTAMSDKVIVTNNLDEDNAAFRDLLRSLDVEVLIRLVPTLEYAVEGQGYILLGPKRNGEQYNNSDVEIFEIMTNELVIAIQNTLRYEEIDKFNVTLQDKIDTATKQLKHTNDKLKALDETKDEFISMASHQLRTPLTSVKGYLSMVLEGDAGELTEMQKKLLGQAFVSSQRMVFLIADLLNLSRLRTGKFVIETKPTNLAEVVEGEISQLRETAEGRRLKLVFNKPDSFTPLMLDETKIRQVVMNFVDNAIYYTPAGGTIEIKLKETKEAAEFTVHDSGIGVPKSEQHHLFNKFYRAGNARKARPDGTGLGLFMAKKVVVAQQGAILFTSTEGKGSIFGFTFSKQKLRVPEKEQPESVKA